MQVKRIIPSRVFKEHGPKGNARIVSKEPVHDEKEFSLSIKLEGSAHPELFSQAGWSETLTWEFELLDDGSPNVGVKAFIKIEGDLWNDDVPPDAAYAFLSLNMFDRGHAPFQMYDLQRSSNDGKGRAVDVLHLAHANTLFRVGDGWPKLELNTTCNVLLDRDPSSRATLEARIKVTLETFNYRE